MYNLIRKIHLYAGLVIVFFLLMYFVTGYALVHPALLTSSKPKPDTQSIPIAEFTGPKTPEAFAEFLESRLHVHGRLIIPPNPPKPGEALKFSIYHPGTTCQIELQPGASALSLKTVHNTLQETLVQLHRIHGYGGGWLFNIWVLLNDLASFSCILFAISGVYLWWKSTKNHLWGFLCLGASCTYALAMILYLLYAR